MGVSNPAGAPVEAALANLETKNAPHYDAASNRSPESRHILLQRMIHG
jgi:hypothetical protein